MVRKPGHFFANLFTRWQWLVLVLAAPFLLFPSPQRSPVMMVVPILWLAAWWVTGRPLPRTPFNLSLCVLAIMVLISEYANYDLGVSLSKIAGVVLGLGMFFAFVNFIFAQGDLKLALGVFLACGLGVAGLGLLGTSWFVKLGFLSSIISHLPKLINGLQGAESGFQPNEVAGSLLWVLPLALSLTILALSGLKRWRASLGKVWTIISLIALLIVLGLVVGVFFLSQSRTAFIAFGLALFLAPVFLLGRRLRWIYVFGLVVTGILVAALAFRLGWVQSIYEDTSSANTSNQSLITLNGRVEIWSRAIYGIQDFPLTGMGMNTFRQEVHVLYPLFTISPTFDFGHAHNELLQAALDLGLPGLVALLSIYLVAFWMLGQTWIFSRRSENLDNGASPGSIWTSPAVVRCLVLGLGGGLLAHTLFGMTDAVALGAKPGILFWMLLGLIAGLYQQQRILRSKRD